MQVHVFQSVRLADTELSNRVRLPYPEGVSVQSGDLILLVDPAGEDDACYGVAHVMVTELQGGLRCLMQRLRLSIRELDQCFPMPPAGMSWSTVAAEALTIFGGAPGLRDYLAQRSLALILAGNACAVREQGGHYRVRIRDAIGHLMARLENPPSPGDSPKLAMDEAFRVAVKSQYRFSCAVCGANRVSPAGCFEVEAVALVPAQDDLRNGIALCRLHAWALREGLFGLSDDGLILVNPEMPEEPMYGPIRAFSGKRLREPGDGRCLPHPLFIGEHRRRHGLSATQT